MKQELGTRTAGFASIPMTKCLLVLKLEELDVILVQSMWHDCTTTQCGEEAHEPVVLWLQSGWQLSRKDFTGIVTFG